MDCSSAGVIVVYLYNIVQCMLVTVELNSMQISYTLTAAVFLKFYSCVCVLHAHAVVCL